MQEYKFIINFPTTNISVGYKPSSIFLNGIQTRAFLIENNIIYFDNTLPVGTVLITVPPTVLRMTDDEIISITIDDVGKRSIFSDPFGKALFSTNASTWVTSLVYTFPATIYCKLAPHDAVLDCSCKVDIEVVVWDGGDNSYIDENNKMVIAEVLPGGLEYEFY